MQRRDVTTARESLQHVAHVANKRVRHIRYFEPLLAMAYLQSADVVLLEQSHESIVRVFADAPAGRGVGLARVIENAKQDGRIVRVMLDEKVLGQAEAARDERHQFVSEACQIL